MRKEASPLVDLKGADYFTQEPIPTWMPSQKLVAYLRDLGLGPVLDQFLSLSLREQQCLKALHVGKSAKETGAALLLSPRTIESYLENIKSKLSCYSKQDLFKLACQFHDLGLLK